MTDWPLVGREAELDAVFARLDHEPPVAFFVFGAAGVGKSRLVREVAARADQRGWTVHLVVGTRAAASIPFGALAPFITDVPEDASSVDMLALAKSALTAGDEATSRILVVDDAQRLDQATATVVHQVVAEGLCRTIATVRSGEPAPEAIETLWTGGLADRIELKGLSRRETDELITTALGGPVNGATRQRLWESSGGNALYLRELVLGATTSGALREDGGIWHLRGSAGLPPRLIELIRLRLDSLDADARTALDLLAVAERIDLDQISELAGLDRLETLEDHGLIEVTEEGGRPIAVLAHPLYGEAVRATMPTLRRRRVCGAVADIVEAAGMSRPGDVVRVASMRLDAGRPVDPALLTTAARRAYIGNDYHLADRLATAARTAGAGVPAGLVLAESAMIAGRHEEAAELLAILADEATTDQERVDVADSRAIVLGIYLGREQEALTVVDETLGSVTDPELADPLRASLAIVLAQVPRPAAAIEAVRPLLDRPSGPHFYRAAYAASLALAVSGRLEHAVAIGRRGYEAHRHLGAAVRFLVEAQHIGPALALLAAGKTQEAGDLVAAGYDAAVAARDSDLQAAFALHAGRICVHRGRLTTAGRHFREAAAIYREPNDVASLRWALGGVALAAGMRSARAASAAAVVELDALDPSPVQLFELDFVERGRAWAAAAAGERSQAVTILRAAAERAAATDQLISEALLRHDLARLGEARHHQARLTELADHVGGEFVPALAEHVHALVSGAAAGLEAAARRLTALDAALLAHEAATDAAAAWRAQGFRRRAEACEDQARRLAADCEGARSPATRTEGGYVALTVREHEVGALAADGLSSREIADKLAVSPRTVENHLQRIYDKLGVSSRQELAAVLDR